MIGKCTLYFPAAKPPFKSAFPKGRTDGGFFRSPTWFEFDSEQGPVRLNLQHPDLAKHLRGLEAHVDRLPDSEDARTQALERIGKTRTAVGVQLQAPIALDSTTFKSLLGLVERFDGFVFVADSILLGDGRCLVGPMARKERDSTAVQSTQPDRYRHEVDTQGVDPARVAMREQHYRELAEHGFECARWLPLDRTEGEQESLRPIDEIARRLLALLALYAWVDAPEEHVSNARVQAFIERNGLDALLTPSERAIFATPRAESRAAHAGMIGWRLENMWALAWILGFEPVPHFFEGQQPRDISRRLLFEFLPDVDASLEDFLATTHPHGADEVVRMEDLYYCAHNAVRQAQGGHPTVPASFHPQRDGGTTHERRHALTWAMSPGVDWDDTDLST